MPVYSFENLIDLSIQRMEPGTLLMPMQSTNRALTGSTRNSPIRESLMHRKGLRYAICGVSTCGDPVVGTK